MSRCTVRQRCGSSSIVAIGPGPSPLPVYQETLREEQVNLAAISQAFAMRHSP